MVNTAGAPYNPRRTEYKQAGKSAHYCTQKRDNIIASRRGPDGRRLFYLGGECMAIMKACPRCRALIPHGLPCCAKCAPLVEADRVNAQAAQARAYNRRRDPRYLSFYRSKEWRVTSRAKLASVAYKCEAGLPGCTGLAVEVHHKKPIQTPDGWTTRLEWENLEALCTSCHNGRHERGKKKTPAGVLDMQAIQKGIK